MFQNFLKIQWSNLGHGENVPQNICKGIYIIILKLYGQHWVPWLSFTIHLYHTSVLVDLIICIYIYIYIYMQVSYNNWCLYNSIAFNSAFIRWWLWVQAWFWGQSIITTSPEHPSSISQHHQTLSDCCRSVGLPDPRWCI